MSDIEEDLELDMPDEKEPEARNVVKDEADASKGAEQSAEAASSTAEDVSKPASEKSTVSIVRDVVGAKEEAAASSAEGAEKDGQASADQTREEQDEFSDVPFNKHPRWKAVIDELKEKRTDATRYHNVETFIAEQGLGGEEAADLLRIGGLIKTNPVEAWKQMKPTIQKLLVAAGEVLTDELVQRVQNGELTHDAALEVSRSRAALQSGQVRRDFETNQFETRQARNAEDALRNEFNSWEDDRKKRDPNFAAKRPMIEKELTWIWHRNGRPTSLAQVREQCEAAYQAASDAYRPPRQQRDKPAIRPIPSGQTAANVSQQQPKTTMDIIKNVVAQRTA